MSAQRDNKVLVVGSGGREHALCWKLAQSPKVRHVICAPGNGGTANSANSSSSANGSSTANCSSIENVDIKVSEFERLAKYCKDEKIDLVVIGPDNPLADGIVDYLEARAIRVFGPKKESAKLEWSKAHAKEFMQKCGLPTAKSLAVNSLEAAAEAVTNNSWARVVKADGLALGKGVFVCQTKDEALEALELMFGQRKFGDAGDVVVLEETLSGEELSLLVLIDGKTILPLAPSQDHKRRFDGDKGPNTGGMGAYSPVELYDRTFDAINDQVLNPLREALKNGTLDYRGVLYIGLMINESGQPKVLEFNARFGDPETQAILPRLESDLFDLLMSCTNGTLSEQKAVWSSQSSCCVVACVDTYPDASSKGAVITIDDNSFQQASASPPAVVFIAGARKDNGNLITDGGRVLSVVGLAPSMEAARERAYEGLKSVHFDGIAFRGDIARRAIKQCQSK